MARPIVETMVFLAVFSYGLIMVLGAPLVWTLYDALNEFNVSVSRFNNELQDGRIVHGIISESTGTGCKAFNCPINQIAAQGADSVDRSLAKRGKVFCVCVPDQDASAVDLALRAVSRNNRHRRAEMVETSIKESNFTFVPPPKTDITPELLAQSLTVQPQDTATVGSVMPHFQDNVISFGVQLNGPVAATMTLNASVSLPCAGIGAQGQAQPDLVLRPKEIDNGTTVAYIPDCTIIAVNMYDPTLVNYWVMNENGSIFSLISSNKVTDIDQLNSTASTSLVLGTKPAGTVKRDLQADVLRKSIKDIVKRAMSTPDSHTASMTPEACAAMKCNNNENKPAVFNPFTKTCWCKDPVYVETETV